MPSCFPDYVSRHSVASTGNLTSHLIEKIGTADSTVWRDVRDAITSITFGFLEIATRVSVYEQ